MSYARFQTRVGIFLLDRAKRRRRDEERLHAVLGDHAPERAGVRRTHRFAFVENRRAALDQRAVHDVRVSNDPADVGRSPEHVARIDAVDRVHAVVQRHRMAAVVAHDALRLAGRAGRIKDVERIGRIDAVPRRPASPPLPSRASRDRASGRATRSTCGRCRITQAVGLWCARRIASSSSGLYGIGALNSMPHDADKHDLRRRVVDANGEFRRGESTEHHRVHRADARAGEHRDRRFRHHRHVDDDPVTLAHAECGKTAGDARHPVAQVPRNVYVRTVPVTGES